MTGRRDGGALVGVAGSIGRSTTSALVQAACDQDTVRVVTVRGPDSLPAVPDIAVVTTLAGADDAVLDAVDGLVDALPSTGTAVLNVGDERVASLGDRVDGDVLRVSAIDPDGADVVALDVRLDDRARARFGARTPWGDAEVALALAGRHHVANALCALAVAGATGADLVSAAAALRTADVPGGTVLDLDGVLVLVDTGHASPVSGLAALDTLGAMQVAGRRVGVLGPMEGLGADHETEHWRIGMRAARVLDRLVVVSEAATPITAGARDAAMPRVELVDDVEAALAALADLQPGDAVLVKGSTTAGLDAVVSGLRDRRTGEAAS